MADGFLSVDPDPAWKRMKRLAKPLFASLGELRDTQVMMEWVAKLAGPGDPVAASLMAQLTAKEAEQKTAAQEFLLAFDRKRWASLNTHLARRTGLIPPEGPVFQHVALERWTDARELHRHALKNRSAVAYHQLRIGIKRFRYTVENFLPERHSKWSRDLRDLQDALGEVHDLDVLRARLRAHAELQPEDRLRWQKRIAQEREQRLNLYRQKMVGRQSLWNVWRAELPAGAALEQAGMEKLRAWASLLDPDNAHSALVEKLAHKLHDGILQCGILRVLGSSRRLLEAAAILHEIGRDGDPGAGGHQKRGYRMVLKLKPPLGWTEEDMRSVAALVRHHRGALPHAGDSSFVGLTVKRRREVMALLGILRLANAFDESHNQTVSDLSVELRNGGLVVSAKGLQKLSVVAQRIARARYLLESVCKQPIMIAALPARMTPRRQPEGTRRRFAAAAR
jgi:hypothetical protein